MRKIPLTLIGMTFLSIAHANDGDYFQTTSEKINAKVTMAKSYLSGMRDLRGLSLKNLFHDNFHSWKKIDQLITNAVSKDICESTACLDYILDYANTTNSVIGNIDFSKELIDGKEAFFFRENMIREAKKSILISSWAIYDDSTGNWLKELLLEKIQNNPEIEIKITVDGQVALRDHHFAVLKELEDKGKGNIEITYWQTKKYNGNGNHRKMLIVDNEKFIIGGMNYGDVYSHMSGDDLWRDTDLYASGNMALGLRNIYAKIWNEQILFNKKSKKNTKMEMIKYAVDPDAEVMAITNHNPGTKREKADQNIITGIVKLISEAQSEIKIENAYFILTAPLENALRKAIDRGVKVTILTNSPTSVDEAVVSNPIFTSAAKAREMGADVYLKKGRTLHSKFMLVDQKFLMIGSYNLHPRSYRFEGEIVGVLSKKDTVMAMDHQFNIDINEENAYKLTEEKAKVVPDSFTAKLARILFFDYL